MKNFILLFVLLTVFSLPTFAKQVDENTAKQVGQNFLTTRTSLNPLSSKKILQLVYTVKSTASSPNTRFQATTYFYVFNTSSNGFVIVAGDDIVSPILGYSDESVFNPNNIPPSVAKWFEGYKSQIRFAIDNDLLPTDEITNNWQVFGNGTTPNSSVIATAGVTPLIQTKWDQSPNYNALCPYDNKFNDRTVTGCVATAMAQIMKFWNYPSNGSGFHSYNHQDYGTLSANFGSTAYQWSSMPNSVSSANSAVATLMYHCGVSVDMDYGVGSTGGSSAYVITSKSAVINCAEFALKTYFGYKNNVQGKERVNYSDLDWKNLLKSELNANRPILYAGFGSGGGHCFVNDGYDNNDFFHFNWGWSGQFDGYFGISALNPGGVGTGGGTGGFNSGHQVVIGIEAPTGAQTFNMGLYNYVIPSSNPLYYGNPFTITTNIANNGTLTFNGDYCAAIFDNANNFVDYVEIKTGFSLAQGKTYTNNLVFSNKGMFGMLPGKYTVGIFYRPTGGNWIFVSNGGSYTNFTSMTVINPNTIEMYASMVVTPGSTLIKGQAVSVNLNIVNGGTSTFKGDYRVDLYALDGNFVQSIDSKTESNGLPSGYTYQAPYLTFSTSSITAEPGTYLMALVYKPTGSTNWQLVGSTNYLNPMKVTVQQSPLQADLYEPNNTVSQAYTLPVAFSGNSTAKSTVGSNCHMGSDYDYYKINLPSGYNYSVAPRLHDSENSSNGNTYTLDALFSYSMDGKTWSDAFDDVMSSSIPVKGGGTVYFHVSPYFSGETGTYLLDIGLVRTPSSSVDEEEIINTIKIYPNPVNGFVVIDLSSYQENVLRVELVDVQGVSLLSCEIPQGQTLITMPLANLTVGTYFVQIQTIKGISTKKIEIAK